jgi:hypothetical protein
MLDLDECYMLKENFHVYKFRALFEVSVPPQEEDESDEDYEARASTATSSQKRIEENLCIMPDGTIIGVRRAIADPFLKDKDVDAVRWGRSKIPEKLMIENSDDLYKLLAAFIPLDETMGY